MLKFTWFDLLMVAILSPLAVLLRAPRRSGLEFMTMEQLHAENWWARADGRHDNEFSRELARRQGVVA